MISIYKTNDKNGLVRSDKIVENCWINLVAPTPEEIALVVKVTGVDEQFIIKILDDEETPRIDTSGNATLIVVDTPCFEDRHPKNRYITMPLGIIICSNNYFITVSLTENEILKDFTTGKIKNFFTFKKTRFTIQILLKISTTYLKYLTIINDEIESKEKVLYKSTGNQELINLLNTEKSLVYFITALKANEIILEKLIKGNIIPLFEDDADLLDDAIIENKQGLEMAILYREILSSMSDTYATIISNNLNSLMKFLAGITIIFSVPTMIASFLGMNVSFGKFGQSDYAFIIVIILSLILSIIIALFLKKKDML